MAKREMASARLDEWGTASSKAPSCPKTEARDSFSAGSARRELPAFRPDKERGVSSLDVTRLLSDSLSRKSISEASELATKIINALPEPFRSKALKALHSNVRQALQWNLDLVFCIDTTNSMGKFIQEVQRTVCRIVEEIAEKANAAVRFALVEYRDHPPEDKTFAARSSAFTQSKEEMLRLVNNMQARGGGDGPESVIDGLVYTSQLPFREECTRMCVLIGDAPPHGIGETGDGFPHGCPCGVRTSDVVDMLFKAGVSVIAVCCEPTISKYKRAREWMTAVAELTTGSVHTLDERSSQFLSDLIVKRAMSEIHTARHVEPEMSEALVEAGVRGLRGPAKVSKAREILREKGVRIMRAVPEGERLGGLDLREEPISEKDLLVFEKRIKSLSRSASLSARASKDARSLEKMSIEIVASLDDDTAIHMTLKSSIRRYTDRA